MEHIKFNVAVPKDFHGEIAAALAEHDHVDIDTETKTGTATPPDGNGLQFEFRVTGEPDIIEITVTKNPHNESAQAIKARVEADIDKYVAAIKG